MTLITSALGQLVFLMVTLISSIALLLSLLRSRYLGRGGEPLRDGPNNGCGGDYLLLSSGFPVKQGNLSFGRNTSSKVALRSCSKFINRAIALPIGRTSNASFHSLGFSVFTRRRAISNSKSMWASAVGCGKSPICVLFLKSCFICVAKEAVSSL